MRRGLLLLRCFAFLRIARPFRAGFLCFLLFSLLPPLHARPQVLILLADHLTLADVTRPDLPNLARLRRTGDLALMSPGLAGKPDPAANVYATLGAGDAVRVGDVSQGRMGTTLRGAGIRTALVGQPDGSDRNARLFLPAPDRVFAADDGGGPAGLWALTQTAFQTSDLVIVFLPSLSSLDTCVGKVLDTYHGTLYLLVPTPPQLPDGSWNSLTPFFYRGRTEQPGTLRSDTTQTDGLIAARDVAPSILTEFALPLPVQMTGAAIASVAGSLPALARMDRLVRLNQEAQNAIFWTVGLGAGAIVFGGLALYLTGRLRGCAGNLARYGLRLLASWTLALLLAPLADPHTVRMYLLEIAGLTALLAFVPTPSLLFTLTALVLVFDGFSGTKLVSNSALSEYALSGIRFYGIGNEYMGVLIGGALLAAGGPPAPILVGQSQRRASLNPAPQSWGGGASFLWFALVTFALSFPAFGAKAGGAITATATFAIASLRLRHREVTWKHLLGSIAAGFALVFVWALLGHWLHLRRTHLESAAGALGQGRFGYILGVALRKIGLAGRVATHPGTILGLIAFSLIGVLGRRLFRRQTVDYLAAHPRFAAVWWAGLWGCAVAVLFNDSGIVAAILILQCLVLTLLHGLYSEDRHAPAGT